MVVLFLGQDVFYLFNLLEDENHFSLALADLKCVGRVLLVEFDQGLLQLQYFFIGQMYLGHHVLFFFFIHQSFFTLAVLRSASLLKPR